MSWWLSPIAFRISRYRFYNMPIDSPGFSFRIMQKLKSKNKEFFEKVKKVHMIAPSVWAYKEKRAKKISKLYDLLLCILPFEPPYFEKYGLKTRTMEEVQSFVGNGLRNLMLQAVEEGEDYPKFEELFLFFKEYYRTHCNIKTAPYEGVLELMKELKERGIKMSIVSNKIDAGVKELNEKFFAEYTEVAIGEREGIGRKPAPDSLNEAIRTMEVEKESTIYVGDSDVDICTARNADVRCVSVTWGFRDEKFLVEHGAGVMIDRPVELLEYLK